MTVVHQLVYVHPKKGWRAKCSPFFTPLRDNPRENHSAWDSRVTCPNCKPTN